MLTTAHRLAAAVAIVVTVLAFGASQVSAGSKKGFVQYSIVGGTPLATPFVSPPPNSGRRMRWVHRRHAIRTLQARARDFGSTVVIGLESMKDLRALRALYGFDHVRPVPGLHAAEVSVVTGQLHALLAAAPKDERIRYVSPLGPTRQLFHMRDDPYVRTINPAISLPYQWQFSSSRVDLALNLSHGDPRILACTIDTGSADVPDLKGKIVARLYADGMIRPDGFDEQGHGTAVASLIVANVDDGIGIAGFGGATRLITLRDEALADNSIARDLDTLTRLGCRIINMSFGGPEPLSPMLQDSINKSLYAGVLLVAAAGNDGEETVSHPAADLQPAGGAPSLGLAVGASDVLGRTATFSNTGANLSLLAPGDYDDACSGGVLVAIPAKSKMWDGSCVSTFDGEGGGRYAYVGGTSFSSPEVAGVAALVWAARPDLRNWEVAEIVKQSARRDAPGWTPSVGYGVLDAAAALELATGRSSADALALTDVRTARSAKWATVKGRVVWSDGVAATDATASCTAAGLRAALTISAGTFACSWRVPARLRDKTVQIRVTAADSESELAVSQSFKLGRPRVP